VYNNVSMSSRLTGVKTTCCFAVNVGRSRGAWAKHFFVFLLEQPTPYAGLPDSQLNETQVTACDIGSWKMLAQRAWCSSAELLINSWRTRARNKDK